MDNQQEQQKILPGEPVKKASRSMKASTRGETLNSTEIRQAQETIQRTNEYDRSLIEAALDPLVTIGTDGKIADVNAATENATGLRREELIGTNFSDYFTEPEKAQAGYEQVFRKTYVRDYPLELKHKNGNVIPVLYNASLYMDKDNNVQGVFAAARDITETKRVEERLRRVNRALSVLNECNRALVRSENEGEFLQQMCEIIVNVGKYRMAWIGFAEQNEAKSVRAVAQVGFEDGYLGLAQISWAENERGRGPTGTAIREGVTQVNQNFLNNPKMAPWRATALARGYQSSIALPLKATNSSTFGVLTIYSATPDAFDEDEVQLLNELADNLTFGINALRIRAERQRAEMSIRQLSSIVEQTEDTVMITDRQGVIEYVNPAFERLTGYSRAEAIGKTPKLLKSGFHEEIFYQTLWKTILDGGVFQAEIANCKKNGELLYEVKTISPLRDSQGEITHFVATGKNITEHKRDEEKLRKAYDELELRVQERTEELTVAKSQLEAHIDNSPLAVIEFDPQFRVMRWSPGAERIFGWKAKEVIGRSISELRWVHEEDIKTVNQISNNMVSGRSPRNLSINRNYNKDGTIVYSEWYNSALYDSQGCMVSIQSLVLDVSKRRLTEDALRKNEATLRGILDVTTESIWLFNPDGTILMANETALSRLRKPAEEVIGKNFSSFMPSAEFAERRQAFLRKVVETGSPLEMEDERAGIFFHHTYCPIKDANGCVTQVVSFSRDITGIKRSSEALQQSEEKYRTLYETMALGIVYQDVNGKIISANPEAERLLGLTQDQLMGRTSMDPLWRAIHEDGTAFPGEEHPIVMARKTRQPVLGIVMGVFHPSANEYHWMNVSAIPQFKPGEKHPYQVYAIFDDITEQKKAEKQILAANEELLRFNKVMVGRELRMIELKREINTMCAQNGQPPRYSLEFEKEE